MKQSLRKSHSTIWKVLMVLIPAIIVTAVIVRQDAADLEAPVQIAPPSVESTESGS